MKSPLVLSSNAKEQINHKINTNLRVFVNRLHSDFPAHWHADVEIIMPLGGPYRVICANQTYDIGVGDILFICPAVLHEIFSLSPGPRLYIQADFLNFVGFKELEKTFRLLSPAIRVTKSTCPPELYDEFFGYIISIAKLYFGLAPSADITEAEDDTSVVYKELEPFCELEIYSHLMKLIASLGRNQHRFVGGTSTSVANTFKNTVSLSNVCAYISEQFTENLTLEQISEYAGFSKYHFERLFREYSGVTFYQYLQRMRLNYAQTLLSNPELSITDIAGQAGFASCITFTRAFKKYTGYTPSEYRMLNEEEHPISMNEHPTP